MRKVKVTDKTLQTATEIPAEELAGNMVLVNTPKIGNAYASLGDIEQYQTQAPRQKHDRLPSACEPLIRWIVDTLAEVKNESFEEFYNAMLREEHPNRELQLWYNIAFVYRRFESGKTKSKKAKIYSFALRCSMVDEQHIQHFFTSTGLTKTFCREISRLYFERSERDSEARSFFCRHFDIAAISEPFESNL